MSKTESIEQSGFLSILNDLDIARCSGEDLAGIARALSVGISKFEYEHAQEISLFFTELIDDPEKTRTALLEWKKALQKAAGGAS